MNEFILPLLLVVMLTRCFEFQHWLSAMIGSHLELQVKTKANKKPFSPKLLFVRAFYHSPEKKGQDPIIMWHKFFYLETTGSTVKMSEISSHKFWPL